MPPAGTARVDSGHELASDPIGLDSILTMSGAGQRPGQITRYRPWQAPHRHSKDRPASYPGLSPRGTAMATCACPRASRDVRRLCPLIVFAIRSLAPGARWFARRQDVVVPTLWQDTTSPTTRSTGPSTTNDHFEIYYSLSSNDILERVAGYAESGLPKTGQRRSEAHLVVQGAVSCSRTPQRVEQQKRRDGCGPGRRRGLSRTVRDACCADRRSADAI